MNSFNYNILMLTSMKLQEGFTYLCVLAKNATILQYIHFSTIKIMNMSENRFYMHA